MNKVTNIRRVSIHDIKAMLEIYRPFIEQTTVSFEETVPTLEEFTSRIFELSATHPCIVSVTDGQLSGYAYSSIHRSRSAYRWTSEVSVYIHKQYRGKGLAGMLYNNLFELLSIQGFKNVLAGIAIPNDASIKMHQKLGFGLVGIYNRVGYKKGKWVNVSWWEKSIGENYSSDPGKLLSVEKAFTLWEKKQNVKP